jgi:heptaprenyl diphosphate synthase
VMPPTPLLRGAPAAHEVWGNTVAILTGDLLFARASMIVADLGPAAVRIQAATFERLCLGQLHETVGPSPEEDPVAHYLQVLGDKTGSLIATAGRFGAMFGGCSAEVIDVMVQYGERVGVAFQLADDVIDLAGIDSGKNPGTDLREGVPTLPVLLVRRSAAEGDPRAAEVVALLDTDLADDAALALAVAALSEHPATGAARAEAVRYAREAVAALDPLPESPAKQALADFAQAVVARTS